MELLKNFSKNSTDVQLTTNALLGITEATCCIVCLLVLIALSVCAKCYSRSTVCGTTIKRLAVGLIVATMLYLFVLALNLVRYFYPEIKDLCKFEGFLAHYLASVQLLLPLDVCLILFLEVLKVTTSCKLEYYEKIKRSTFTTTANNPVTLLGLPLTVAVILSLLNLHPLSDMSNKKTTLQKRKGCFDPIWLPQFPTSLL